MIFHLLILYYKQNEWNRDDLSALQSDGGIKFP